MRGLQHFYWQYEGTDDSSGGDLPPWLRDESPAEEPAPEKKPLPKLSGLPPRPAARPSQPPLSSEEEAIPPWLRESAVKPVEESRDFSQEWLAAADSLPETIDTELTYDQWVLMQEEMKRPKSVEEEVPDLFSSPPSEAEAPTAGTSALGGTGALPDWFLGLDELDVSETPDWLTTSGTGLLEPTDGEPESRPVSPSSPTTALTPPSAQSDAIESFFSSLQSSPVYEEEEAFNPFGETEQPDSSGFEGGEELPDLDWVANQPYEEAQADDSYTGTEMDAFFHSLSKQTAEAVTGELKMPPGMEEEPEIPHGATEPVPAALTDEELPTDIPSKLRTDSLPEVDWFAAAGIAAAQQGGQSGSDIEEPDFEQIISVPEINFGIDEEEEQYIPEAEPGEVVIDDQTMSWLSELQGIVASATGMAEDEPVEVSAEDFYAPPLEPLEIEPLEIEAEELVDEELPLLDLGLAAEDVLEAEEPIQADLPSESAASAHEYDWDAVSSVVDEMDDSEGYGLNPSWIEAIDEEAAAAAAMEMPPEDAGDTLFAESPLAPPPAPSRPELTGMLTRAMMGDTIEEAFEPPLHPEHAQDPLAWMQGMDISLAPPSMEEIQTAGEEELDSVWMVESLFDEGAGAVDSGDSEDAFGDVDFDTLVKSSTEMPAVQPVPDEDFPTDFSFDQLTENYEPSSVTGVYAQGVILEETPRKPAEQAADFDPDAEDPFASLIQPSASPEDGSSAEEDFPPDISFEQLAEDYQPTPSISLYERQGMTYEEATGSLTDPEEAEAPGAEPDSGAGALDWLEAVRAEVPDQPEQPEDEAESGSLDHAGQLALGAAAVIHDGAEQDADSMAGIESLSAEDEAQAADIDWLFAMQSEGELSVEETAAAQNAADLAAFEQSLFGSVEAATSIPEADEASSWMSDALFEGDSPEESAGAGDLSVDDAAAWMDDNLFAAPEDGSALQDQVDAAAEMGSFAEDELAEQAAFDAAAAQSTLINDESDRIDDEADYPALREPEPELPPNWLDESLPLEVQVGNEPLYGGEGAPEDGQSGLVDSTGEPSFDANLLMTDDAAAEASIAADFLVDEDALALVEEDADDDWLRAVAAQQDDESMAAAALGELPDFAFEGGESELELPAGGFAQAGNGGDELPGDDFFLEFGMAAEASADSEAVGGEQPDLDWLAAAAGTGAVAALDQQPEGDRDIFAQWDQPAIEQPDDLFADLEELPSAQQEAPNLSDWGDPDAGSLYDASSEQPAPDDWLSEYSQEETGWSAEQPPAEEPQFEDIDSYLKSLKLQTGTIKPITHSLLEPDAELESLLTAPEYDVGSTPQNYNPYGGSQAFDMSDPEIADLAAAETPDWLADVSVGEVSASAIVRQRKDKEESELDERLKKLRRRSEKQAPAAATAAMDDALSSVVGSAAGELSAAAIGIDTSSKAAAATVSLSLTPKQQSQAAVLSSMVATTTGAGAAGEKVPSAIDETFESSYLPELEDDSEHIVYTPKDAGKAAAEKPRRARRRSKVRIDRLLIIVLIIIAILLPFFLRDARVGEPPPSSFAADSQAQAVFDQIEQLPPGAVVLVGMEYGSGSAPELDSMAEALLRHILMKNAYPVIISGNAATLLRAEIIMDGIANDPAFLELIGADQPLQANADYYLVNFIPGGQLGLRAFSENTAQLVANDLSGQATGLNIHSLRDFAGIVIIADRADDIRSYAEQIAPLAQAPLVGAVGQASAPVAEAYVTSGDDADALAGLLVGYEDAYTYNTLIGNVPPQPFESLLTGLLPESTAEATPEPDGGASLIPPVSPTAALPTPAAQIVPRGDNRPAPLLFTPSPTFTYTSTPLPPTNTPTPTPTPTLTPTPTIGVVVSNQAVNLRELPSIDSPIIQQIAPGTQVTVIGFSDTRDWVNVRLSDGTTGWVSAALVQLGAGASIPSRGAAAKRHFAMQQDSTPGTPEEEITEESTITSTRTPRPSATPSRTTRPSATPTRTPRPTATSVPVIEQVVEATAETTPEFAAAPPPPSSPGLREERWYALTAGILISSVIIGTGAIINIGRALARRRRSR